MKDFFSKPDDILTAAEKYIAENGTEDLQHLINRVCTLTHYESMQAYASNPSISFS